MKAIKWTIGRIIDFEYFLKQDKICNDENYLQKRDKDIYLNNIKPKLNLKYLQKNDMNSIARRNILLLWLETIKNREVEAIKDNWFIGDIYEESLHLLKILFIIAGFAFGVSICLTFFSYTGHQPLNVSYFLAITLVPQICLMISLLLVFLISNFSYIKSNLNSNLKSNLKSNLSSIHNSRRFSLYYFIGLIIQKILMLINRKALCDRLSSNKKDALFSAFGIIKHDHQVYGSLFVLPVFMLTQLFGITFNVGVLVSTIFRILFFDNAFGWQSTLQVSPTFIAKMVEIVATPWKWLFPSGVGFPNLDQIIGSRIILKDGIYNMTTSDLVSWWPFLCMTIFFYGLLPRTVFFVSGLISLQRTLQDQKFDHLDCLKLINRMVMITDIEEDMAIVPQTPIVSQKTPIVSQKAPIVPQKAPIVSQKAPIVSQKVPIVPQKAPIVSQKTTVQNQIKQCIALVPDDINDFITIDIFIDLIKNKHGYNIKKEIVIGIDFENDMNSIQIEYAASVESVASVAIVLIQEAWQPPIKETLNFIKAIRKMVDKKTPLIVILIGKVIQDSKLFTKVDETDWEVWKMKLSTIDDPWLTIDRIV